MSDGVTLPGTGSVVATEDIGSKQYQLVKLVVGAHGLASLVEDQAGLPVKIVGNPLIRSALLAAITATAAGSAFADNGHAPSFSADLSGTGAITATVIIQARNVASGQWVNLGTITLTGTGTACDGFASLARYMEYRANCTAITGTGATLSVSMGS